MQNNEQWMLSVSYCNNKQFVFEQKIMCTNELDMEIEM